ncbi:MAG: class II glutamine amidotransferase [Burkholderiales bacterium]|nr:class II glutamine amidotransferase [Burkholderiales bacterium]
MCRFTLYLGPSIRLSTLLIEPAHSLIHQSFRALERDEPLNGDGFGVGWYAPRLSAEPAVFHSISPAWNNRNLRSIARVVASPCVLAHVRAATAGSEVHQANCHPFQHGRYLLMHNGSVGAFQRVRRRLLAGLSDEAYNVIRGNTDSEHMFAIFVDELLKSGEPPQAGPAVPDAARRLAEHLAATLARVLAVVKAEGGSAPSFLNVAVSDGVHAAVSRFTSHPSLPPDSLYTLQDHIYETTSQEFAERRSEDEGAAVVVSSERLTGDTSWKSVPPNHVVAFARGEAPRLFPLSGEGQLAAA